LAIGNIGKRCEAGAGQHAGKAHATGCCDANQKPRSHDTSRIAWAKLMARLGEEFPLQCPGCGGAIRLIAFITEPGPIRKILTHLGEPLEPPPVSPARGPPTDWAEHVQAHDERDVIQSSPQELPAIDIHKRPTRTRSAPTREKRQQSGCGASRETHSGRPGPLLPRLTSRSSAGRPLPKCH
ncbi:MAG: hypothetical protein ACKOEX_12025, partial [Planctomycetia bacterium]